MATAPAGATTAVDSFGPPAAGVSYFYRVTAVRSVDSSSVAHSAATVVTPTLTALSATAVRVNWTDRSTLNTATRPTNGNATTQSLVTLNWNVLSAAPSVGGYRDQPAWCGQGHPGLTHRARGQGAAHALRQPHSLRRRHRLRTYLDNP